MNRFGIERASKRRKAKGWDKTYWCIDMHDVVVKASYTSGHNWVFAKDAKGVLQYLSARPDMVLILWTSSYEDYIFYFLVFCRENGINFDYVNKNPECPDDDLARFEDKFYFDIILDDKAGFEHETDWPIVGDEILKWFPPVV
jgi:hypothetical protein